jgi:hypothetical protein
MKEVPFMSIRHIKRVVEKKAKEYGAKKVENSVFEAVYKKAASWQDMEFYNTKTKAKLVRGITGSLRNDMYDLGFTFEVENKVLVLRNNAPLV